MKRVGIVYIVLLCLVFQNNESLYSATKQETLESHFDIVETFDELRAWKGTNSSDVTKQNDMPKKLDNSASMWNYYSWWKSSASSTNWIDDFGAGTKIGNTGKSLIIDLNAQHDKPQSQLGPSRLGLYFTNANGYATSGLPTDGYQEIYIFYRTKISANQWPTSITNCTGDIRCDATFSQAELTQNGGYAWYGSWKFGTLVYGFTDVGHHNYGSTFSPYGNWPVVPHILPYSGQPTNGNPILFLSNKSYIWPSGSKYIQKTYAKDLAGVNSIIPTDSWIGVEFHFKMGTPGAGDSEVDFWYYDSLGNSVHVLHQSNIELQNPSEDGFGYNKFFFGGNNSDAYHWDYNTMVSHYYVDDFIVDDQRIGPAYFALEGQGGDDTPPTAPAGVRTQE